MSYHYEATSDFIQSASEIETLLNLARENEDNRILFLKLAHVSLVTKFQVFVESVLNEFRFQLNGKSNTALSTYLLMNSLYISLPKSILTSFPKKHIFSDDNREKIINYLQSIAYISHSNNQITDDLCFETKFPLGKTGKKDLINLLKQIDGNATPFAEFGEEKMAQFDSILQFRHVIVHQDHFPGTETTVENSITLIQELVEYIDEYLANRMTEIEERIAQ